MSSKKTWVVVSGLLFCWGTGCVPVDNGDGANGGDGNGDGNGAGEPAPTLFATSNRCAPCHNGLTDEADNDVSIETAWRGTMMANAARDPYFLAQVRMETLRAPGLADVIEDKCATCHTPMAHTQAFADGVSTGLLDTGFIDPANDLHTEGIDGVSCTVCHQIEDVGLGEPTSFSGGFSIDTETESPDRLNYGPYVDPDQESMRAASGFTPAYGEHMKESALCATCHTLYTPYVDAEGNVLGEFPEQVAFLEWRHSDFGDGTADDRSCQDCHMPPAEGEVAISIAPAGLPPRSPFARHLFVGGNTMMLDILDEHRDELEVAASAEDFAAVKARVLDQLRNNTSGLVFVATEAVGDSIDVLLNVANRAGHKLPTGFPARRLWIHLTVSDGSGAVFFESGAPLADGSIAGNDADESLAAFEPHYATITGDDEVQIYEAVMLNSDGEVTYTLLRGASYGKDNRLLPVGFDKATAEDDFATVGAALVDGDFGGGADEITYSVDTTGHQGPFTVVAELLFQSVSFPFVQDMRSEDATLINRFVGYYDEADKTPIVVATAETTIEIE